MENFKETLQELLNDGNLKDLARKLRSGEITLVGKINELEKKYNKAFQSELYQRKLKRELEELVKFLAKFNPQLWNEYHWVKSEEKDITKKAITSSLVEGIGWSIGLALINPPLIPIPFLFKALLEKIDARWGKTYVYKQLLATAKNTAFLVDKEIFSHFYLDFYLRNEDAFKEHFKRLNVGEMKYFVKKFESLKKRNTKLDEWMNQCINN